MFGFQPVPLSSQYTLPSPPDYSPPPTPPNPCNESISWIDPNSDGYLDTVYAEAGTDFSLDLSQYINSTPLGLVYRHITITDGALPNGLALNKTGYISGTVSCNTSGDYEVELSLRLDPDICPGSTISTIRLIINTTCTSAAWSTNTITAYGSANNTITVDLSDYVTESSLRCTQTYFFSPDGSETSYSLNGSVLQIVYGLYGSYSGSFATVSNSCQQGAGVSVNIVFEVS